MITLANASSMFEAARQFFSRKDELISKDAPIPTQAPEDMESLLSMDQNRYARILEDELDRQHMSNVEREDMDTLDRVRAALYEG